MLLMLLLYNGKENYFLKMKVILEPSLFLIVCSPLTPPVDDVEMQTTSLHPIIKVGTIDVLALSSSAILHIGNSEHIQSETRILHIRQVETVEESECNKIQRRNKECLHLLAPFKS